MPKRGSLRCVRRSSDLYQCRHMSGLQQASASVLQAAKARIDARRTSLPSPRNDVCSQIKQNEKWFARAVIAAIARQTAWILQFQTKILVA